MLLELWLISIQFILDEEDTLLDMGFRSEIDAITEFLPPNTAKTNLHVLCGGSSLSATLRAEF